MKDRVIWLIREFDQFSDFEDVFGSEEEARRWAEWRISYFSREQREKINVSLEKYIVPVEDDDERPLKDVLEGYDETLSEAYCWSKLQDHMVYCEDLNKARWAKWPWEK